MCVETPTILAIMEAPTICPEDTEAELSWNRQLVGHPGFIQSVSGAKGLGLRAQSTQMMGMLM